MGGVWPLRVQYNAQFRARIGAIVVKVLYMPMEIASREMDSRLLIALSAAACGVETILGQKWVLQKNIERSPRGAWLFKTLTPGDANPMRRAREAGHLVCAIDEEIPGLGKNCGGLRWVAQESMSHCDMLFCLGKAHERAMARKFPGQTRKCVITGNPRWDLLRKELRGLYSAEAREISKRHGRFVLYNTNSGLTNSAKAPADKLIKALFSDGRLDRNKEADRELVKRLKSFEAANIAAAPRIVRALAETFPSTKFILRPHPTERMETYIEPLKGLANAEILSGGPAAPWILASELLIHTSCTTANEAFALGKPIINFEASDSPLHDEYFFSARISRRTASLQETVEWTREVLQGKAKRAEWRSPEMLEAFHDTFAAQEGAFAARRIAEIISQNLGQATSGSWEPPSGFRRRRLWRKSFQRRIFPDAPAAQLQQRLDTLAALSDTPKASIRRIGQALYHVRPA